MKNLFDKQPLSSEAPQGLRNKVEFAARQKPGRQWFGPRMRWAAAGTAVAAAAIGGIMFMTPATAEAKTWDMVTAAYQQVRGVLIEMEFSGQGDQGKIMIAGKGNDWRVSVDGTNVGKGEAMDVSYSNGELTIWDGGDTAQVMSLGINIPFSPEDVMKGMAEQLSASKIFEEHADEIGRDNIRIEQPTYVNNRHVYNVFIDDKDGDGSVHILVDADTDLPISMEIGGTNGEAMKMSFEFDGEFDSSLLRPILPSGIKIERMDMSKMMGGQGGNHEEMLKGLEQFGRSFDNMHRGGDQVDQKVEVKEDKSVRIDPAVLNG